jgi:hypothetical protein
MKWLAIALLASACGGDGGSADAAADAPGRLALTVDGPASVQPTTRSVKITISASGYSHTDTVPVAGLPATLDLTQPIALNTWTVVGDAYDMNTQPIAHGMTTLPARSSEGMLMLAAP